jgi:hypothetical protein
MDIPIAFPVGIDYKVPEVYTLEQKQEALAIAEQELDALLRSSEDFFETREEMDEILRELRQHPDQVYTKPFMKKIAAAILCVNACRQDVEWASESVEDTSLTPAQVKAQVKQMMDTQRVTLERQFDQRMKSDRSEWSAQLQQLRDELAEERTHRKAFQSKVKDFSEEVWVIIFKYNQTYGHELAVVPHQFMEKLRKVVGILEPAWGDPSGCRLNTIYKRAGLTEADCCFSIEEYNKNDKGEKTRQWKIKALETFTPTVFDGTEK